MANNKKVQVTATNEQTIDGNIIDEMMEQSTHANKSCFSTLLDVECIRKHIDIEFETLSNFAVIKALFIIYIFSIIDIITDILFTLKVSSLMGDNCAEALIKYGAIPMGYELTVLFLWFSTICAVIYTLICKYYAAYKVMKKYKISYWNSLKYVAICTQLKLDIRYSRCCNKYQLLRIFIVLFEDIIQLTIGFMFISYTNADAVILLSTSLSTIAVVYTMSYAIYRLFHDMMHKIASCCCTCTICKAICIRNACKCCEMLCKWCCIGGSLLLTMILLMVFIINSYGDAENVYIDYGFMYGNVEFNINYLEVTFSDYDYYEQNSGDNDIYFDVYNYSLNRKVYGNSKDAIYCIDYDLFNVDKYVEMNRYTSWGDDSFSLYVTNNGNITYPIICFKVSRKYLRIYFMNNRTNDQQYYETETMLQFTKDGATVNYPKDFVLCDKNSDYNCNDHVLSQNASNEWSIHYKFTNIVDCESI